MSSQSSSGHQSSSGQAGPILTQPPPSSLRGILRRLGPGLIVAGSIVGSGELIATTKTGAEAGFWLLWLILIGCVIKVFVQVEFGRYSIITGKSTMTGLNEVPGPFLRISAGPRDNAAKLGGNWIVWYWFVMWFASIGQLGGIVGGVGQALSIRWPLTAEGREFNEYVDHKTQLSVAKGELALILARLEEGDAGEQSRADELTLQVAEHQRWLQAANSPLLRELGERQWQKLAEKVDLQQRNEQADNALRNLLGMERYYQLTAENKGLGVGLGVARYDRAVLQEELGKARFRQLGERPSPPFDDRYWAGIIAVLTSIVLVLGRYGLIQTFSTVMVCAFTFITVVNLAMLQSNAAWSVTVDDLIQGMSFRLPPGAGSGKALATALATFGIIGVGASELVTYPYWCLEKGYARFTGPRDDSPEWAVRANGWMRVMRWDAWCSMVVYTFATVAFYLLGAAVLGRTQLNPEKSDMIRTLAVMYEPVFTEWASILFLFGAFAVLYSTFFVANASHARVFADTLGVLGVAADTPEAGRRRVIYLSGFFPLLCWVLYALFPNPAQLVLISGFMQAVMLPMLAAAGLHFRYRCGDARVAPGKLWDAFLLVSAVGMLIAGVWAVLSQFR